MKKTLITLLALGGMAMLLMPACKKSDTLVTSNGGTPGTLTASTTTPVLKLANTGDVTTQVISFSFTNPVYNFNAAITNTLQIDVPSDNWKKPTSFTLATGVLTQSFDDLDFDNLLLKLGLPGGVATTVNVRVMQALSSQVTPIYSNVITLNVTPFYLTSWVYLVGQFNGYSTTAPDSLISTTGNGIYTGIINVTAGNTRFLVLPQKNFNTKYATVTNPDLTSASVTYATEFVTSGGNDLYTPAAPGIYCITLNTNTNSITVAPANTYSIIGTTVGDVNTYSVDVPLTKFINDGKTGWQGSANFNAGNFKIRQNNDWTFSWGTLATPDGVTLTDNNGGNIPVTAGMHTVTFNIAASAKGASASSSTPPSVTATYTLK